VGLSSFFELVSSFIFHHKQVVEKHLDLGEKNLNLLWVACDANLVPNLRPFFQR